MTALYALITTLQDGKETVRRILLEPGVSMGSLVGVTSIQIASGPAMMTATEAKAAAWGRLKPRPRSPQSQCHDCGAEGERTGHQACPSPQDRP